MKRNRLLSLLALSFVSLIILQSNSGGYQSAIVAPSATPGCSGTSCHATSSQNQGAFRIELFDTATNTKVTTYKANTSYEIQVSLDKFSANPTAGMQLTVFDGTSNSIGTFPGIQSNTHLREVQSPKKFITHSKSDVLDIRVSSTVIWKLYWKSPLLGGNLITISALGNDANGDLNEGGDLIRHATLLVPQNSVGLNDIAKGIVAIYPNPTTSNLTVKLDSDKASKISVFSITGQLVKQLNTNGDDIKMDVSTFANGNYIVVVEQDENLARMQFMKY